MDFGPFDRRQFLAGGGAAFVCTLAGHKLFVDQPADLPKLAGDVKVPPKVAAASGPAGTQFVSDTTASAAVRAQRQYWISAEERGWNIVPTGRDEMMDKKVKGDTQFKAYTYRAYSPNFGGAAQARQDPRPADRGEHRRHDRRPLPEQAQGAGDDPPARRLLHAGDGRRLQGQVHGPGGLRPAGRGVHLHLGRAPRHRGDLALPRPRADGPDPALQGADGPAHHPRPGETQARRGVLHLHARATASGHQPAAAVRVHERPCLRGQHADARVEGGRPGRLPRDRARQRLPHVPHPRPPLGGRTGR